MKNSKSLLKTISIVLLLNIIGNFVFKRFDLTADKRYTLSNTSLDIVKQINETVVIDVFLDGDFPGEFKKLQTETSDLLEEFKAYNNDVVINFMNPLDEDESLNEEKKRIIYDVFRINNRITNKNEEAEIKKSIAQITNFNEALLKSFAGNGMLPISVTLEDKGKQTQEAVLPWAIVSYKNRVAKVPLLKNMLGASTAEKVVSSVQHLEYAFANALNTVSKDKEKKVAVLKGNGQLEDVRMGDFIKSVRENYYIGPFTLDSVATNPKGTQQAIKEYDLIVVAKPTEKFSDEEKQVLDQYIINGGKSLWLLDHVNVDMDSLYNESGATLAVARDLNLTDMFFKYGIRVNPTLIKDIQATPISIASGMQGSATQYTQYPWLFSPMIYPLTKNPIVNNLDGIKFEFANPIEILKNNTKATVLLQSSKYSKLVGTPLEINLNMVAEEPKPEDFPTAGNFPVAVLLEGNLNSVYQNRVTAFDDKAFNAQGKNNKIIVISDGDVIKNQLDKNLQPLELGYDKWTNNMYANKEFLLNCVNYLLDENGLINIRSKEVELPMLDKEKVYKNYTSSQVLTIGVPIVILGLFGFLFTFLRKKKYAK